MGNLDEDSGNLLKGYLASREIELNHERAVIEEINDSARLVARLDRTSEKLKDMVAVTSIAMVNQMDDFYRLVYLWKQWRNKKYGQINFREFIEERMSVVLYAKRDEGIGIQEILQYLGRTPICSNPQKILLSHLRMMIRGNIWLIKIIIKEKLELPYNLKGFFAQEVERLVSE